MKSKSVWRQVPIACLFYVKGPQVAAKQGSCSTWLGGSRRPLITVSCHDDLSTSDLVGRYLIKNNETFWQDGPLTLAVRAGAICYLDEIVEARKDTTVVIHPLTDDRRELPVENLANCTWLRRILCWPCLIILVIRACLKDLKPSTRQRFVSLNFDYPSAELEQEIVMRESRADEKMAIRWLNLQP